MYYYISSGITSTGITLYNDDGMYISSGGVANSTTVNSGGMYISSGGTALEIIENGGYVGVENGANVTFASNTINGLTLSYTSMTVHSNTVANSTTVNSSGYMYIYSGGVANSNIVNSGGRMSISSGGTALEIIENGGYVYVENGANVTFASNTIDGLTLSGGGSMTVHSNTVANSTTVNSYGRMFISSGGVANSTTINGGDMYISSGGVATSTTINGGMCISSGGVANNTTVDDWGSIVISSGGVANSTTVNSGGYMYISSGGTATDIVWTPCVGYVYVDYGAYVTYASQYSGVYFGSDNQLLSSAQIMDDKVVCGWDGDMYVMNDGVANNTTVDSGGYMYIYSGGVANSTTINDGDMYIYSGGTATDIVAEENVTLNITVASNTYIQGTYAGSAFEMKNAQITGFTVRDDISMSIYGGTVNSTTIDYGGFMYISSGGVANSTTINAGGRMVIFSGGVANSTTINAGGGMVISSGGVANSTTINGGDMYICSGGVANSTTINANGGMVIYSGGIANSTTVNGGDMYIYYDGVANSTIVNSGRLTIDSGGVANSTTINGGGMVIYSGGGVNDTTINSNASMQISAGVIANSTTVNGGGIVLLYSNGVANDTTVNSGGEFEVHNGGLVDSLTVSAGGLLETYRDARTTQAGYSITNLILADGANFNLHITTESYIQGYSEVCGNFEVKNGVIQDFALSRGDSVKLYSGAVADNIQIGPSGDEDKTACMFIYSGAVANNTTVDGLGNYLHIIGGSAGNTVVNNGAEMLFNSGDGSNTTVNSGGSMLVQNGTHRGSLQIENGAYVYVSEGSIIDFTVADRAVSDNYLINDLSLIQGAPTYTITVSEDQAYGIYKLAQGAENFSGTISIGNGTTQYGTITVNGDSKECGGAIYTLTQTDGNLLLNVEQKPSVFIFSNGICTSSGTEITGASIAGDSVFMFIESKGIANNTTVSSDGWIVMEYGGTADGTIITAGGSMSVDVYGIARNTTVCSGGSMLIDSYGSADNTIVYSAGTLNILTGGTATNITAAAGAQLFIPVASNTYIQGTYAGSTFEVKDAQISDFTIGKAIDLTIESGAAATNIVINSDGRMHVAANNAIANNTVINSGGYMNLNGKADNTVINAGGTMYLDVSYAAAGNTEVNSGGSMCISYGTANSTTVNSGGSMFVDWGGSAIDTEVYAGGVMHVYEEALASGLVVSGNHATEEYAKVYVSGGTVNDVDVYDKGAVYIYSSVTGTANNIEVYSGGYLGAYEDSVVSNVVIYSGGRADYDGRSNCTVDQTLLKSGGYLFILADAHITNLTAEKGADLWLGITSDTYVSGTSGGYEFKIESGYLANYNCEKGQVIIHNGGSAGSIYTQDRLVVQTGASIDYASLWGVSEDGREAQMLLRGTANSVTVGTNALLMLEGSATNLRIDAGILSLDGGSFSNCSASAGVVINGITLGMYQYFYNGVLDIRYGQVNKYDYSNHDLASGNTATSTTINDGGYLKVLAGAVMTDTQIKSGGSMTLLGEHRGELQIEEGGRVTADSSAVIDFTLSGRTTESDYLINDLSLISGTPTYTITVSANQTTGEYKLAQGAEEITGTITIGDGTTDYGNLTVNGHYLQYGDRLYELKNQNGDLTLSIYSTATPGGLTGSVNGVSWDSSGYVKGYVVQYSYDNFDTAISLSASTTAVDTYNLPPESYLWQVKAFGGDWSDSGIIVGEDRQIQPQLVESDQDGDLDLFFASANGRWSASYAAAHQGIKDIWSGTAEWVSLGGKNKLEDIFVGSTDASILVLTDTRNGDALFVDDIFSAFPDELEAQSRIAEINEIRAGAGNDIIDLTSRQFEYIGDGITVYGGLGNDTIWANSGENQLFGDAGNDRIVGGSDNDIIVGGAGNDSMHGGGGSDTFCFGSDWGIDIIEQLADGTVTLWFESGSEDFWNAETLTYSDGANRVTIKGITADAVSLKFGEIETAIAGAFENAASEKIFEDQDKALLA